MKTVFVSCQNVDAVYAQEFIRALKTADIAVEHSPSNPESGADARWDNWYDDLLPKTIEKADACVIVLDRGWDSSTWMGIEGEEALGRMRGRPALPMYVYNPLGIKFPRNVMSIYLKELLPSDAKTAAEYLLSELEQLTS